MNMGLYLIVVNIVLWWVGLGLLFITDSPTNFIIVWLIMSLGIATLFLILSLLDLESGR